MSVILNPTHRYGRALLAYAQDLVGRDEVLCYAM